MLIYCGAGDEQYIARQLGWTTEEVAREAARTREEVRRARERNATRAKPQPNQASEYNADGTWKYAAIAAEVKASNDGKALGAKYGSDPWRACKALGIPILTRDPHALNADEGRSIMGRWMPRAKRIELSDRLSAADMRTTLAHELGHMRLGHTDNSIDAEQHADAFAKAFLAATPHPMQSQAQAKADWDARLLRRAARR